MHKLSYKHYAYSQIQTGRYESMSENLHGCVPCDAAQLRNALSIHTRKITDSCRDKDCVEDIRVYLTKGSQAILDTASSAKVRCADILSTYVDVEPVAFDRNHYCVDVTFYYRVLADAIIGSNRPAALYGVAAFSKRVVLCGEESQAHIYTSDGLDGESGCAGSLPVAVVEVLDPIVLSSRIKEVCDCQRQENAHIPTKVSRMFDDELVLSGDRRRLYVTLGQFSIIRLERDIQLVVPVLGYSIPTKECCESTGCVENPCELFSRIPFPANQFTLKGCDRSLEAPESGSCSCCHSAEDL